MIEYTLVTAAYWEQLEKQVNVKIAEGWLPCGGIAVTNAVIAQAMTRARRGSA